MEATLRPYDRGEEVTTFATLGLYHAYRVLSARGGVDGSEQKRVRKKREVVNGIPGPPQLTNVSRQDRWRDPFRLHGWQDSATVFPALRTPTVAVLST